MSNHALNGKINASSPLNVPLAAYNNVRRGQAVLMMYDIGVVALLHYQVFYNAWMLVLVVKTLQLLMISYENFLGLLLKKLT